MQNVTLKVIMVGDSRVGKSQLCRRVTNRSFEVCSTTTTIIYDDDDGDD